MNNAFEILVFLAFFAPVGLMVALNLLMYRESRYVSQPPAPMLPAASALRPLPAVVANELDFRQAA